METVLHSLNPVVKTKDKVDSWNREFLERHQLLGHAYRRTQDKTYFPYWKNQENRNLLAKKELEKIGQALDGEVSVFLLKGFSLMGEIYKDWGERAVSDVELLISADSLWKLTDILRMYGYIKKKEVKWLANRHRHTFIKNCDGVQLSIDVHTQLFWHTRMNQVENSQPAKIPGFHQLSRENQLIHLCGDLAFQQGYTQLFLLMDIYKYIEQYRKDLNWEKFWTMAEKVNLYKSCFFSLFLCQKLGLNIQPIIYRAKKKKKVAIYLLKKIVNYSYLYNPESYWLRKLMVKFMIKDSAVDNIRYFYGWLKTFR